jgi:GTP-binding protein
MRIKSANFVISSPKEKDCPTPDRPEFAFIGRSNVGKSSLINMLTGRKALAKVSARPGKTQLINHFLINESWYLVDLPGYGWAQVSKSDKLRWKSMIEDYLIQRRSLMNVFVLIDSRLEAQAIDLEFMHFLGEEAVPFSIVFTKTDKMKQGKLSSQLNLYRKELLKTWESLPPQFETSAVEGRGREDILDYIDTILQSVGH